MDLQNDLDELDEYLVGADFLPGSTPASAAMSDHELAALEAEIFGFDDIEGVVGAFIADCVNNAACEITAHGLLVPDPCLLYTSPSPRDGLLSRMPSSA